MVTDKSDTGWDTTHSQMVIKPASLSVTLCQIAYLQRMIYLTIIKQIRKEYANICKRLPNSYIYWVRQQKVELFIVFTNHFKIKLYILVHFLSNQIPVDSRIPVVSDSLCYFLQITK